MTECPRCRFKFPARAKIGEGTQLAKRKKKLNQNQLGISEIFLESDRPLLTKEVQGILYKKGVKRHRRGEQAPTGEWNYHLVQAEISILLGLNLVTMTRTKEDFDEYGFKARPIPRYYMTELEKERFSKIKARQGRIN